MTSWLARLYCGLFLAEQIAGLHVAAAAFLSPELGRSVGASPGIAALSLIMLVGAPLFALYVWRRGASRLLLSLPGYDLLGIAVMAVFPRLGMTTVLHSLTLVGGPVSAADALVLLEPDLLLLILGHSVIGLLVGTQVMWLVTRHRG